ncbi:hypothetical protein C7271_25365, partial [filamentous cyanobacterium CCP5]
DSQTRQSIKPASHGYYLYSPKGEVKADNCFLIGDSAGLASVDLAEGIAPAVESGVMAASEILEQGQYVKAKMEHTSPLATLWRLRFGAS